MNILLLLIVSFICVNTNAFVIRHNDHHHNVMRHQTTRAATVVLSLTKASSIEAIAAATAASKQYGPTSPEARVAWDIVEELNSADNSAALGGSLDEECEIVDAETVNNACMEYGEKLVELNTLLKQNTQYVSNMKNIASELKAISMTVAAAKPAARSPAVTAALENAKATETQYGKNSPEARVAWSELEEIASAGLENAMTPIVDSTNCIIDSSIDACEAIEEVSRVLAKELK